MGGDAEGGKGRGSAVRGPALRRKLALGLAAPDLAKDKGGALVVDVTAVDLGADEIAEPLFTLADGRR